MNNLVEVKEFKHEVFGDLKVIEQDGKIWFDGNEVANKLGYKEPHKAISRHCKGGMKHPTLKNNGGYPLTIIPEGDLYRLIMGSTLPSAEKFEVWVFEEVLPSIRKNGGYISNQENSTPAEIVANALIVANNIIIEKEQRLKEIEEKLELQAPKVEAWSQFMDMDKSIDMGEFSKILNIKGLGRNNLMELLRNKKIFRANNEPYQSYVNSGYFIVIAINNFYSPTKTLITPKGMMWLEKKLNKDWIS